MSVEPPVADPEALRARLEAAGYLADVPTATSCFLALRMGKPLFCEGEAGVGKTALAAAVARAFGWKLHRLQCYEGLTASEALYAWDFPRQLLHLRAAEHVRGTSDSGSASASALEGELYSRRFLLPRAILRAFEDAPSVLLIDEVDRADDEFEAFLLEALSEFSITIPEYGTVRAATPPFVLLTSNRTREVHDALKRRCLYQWLDHPKADRELAIIQQRFPGVPDSLSHAVVRATRRLRRAELMKPPGVAEALDWTEALLAVDATALDVDAVTATLGAVVKYREDQARVSRDGFAAILRREGL